jgi:hypothetical protein
MYKLLVNRLLPALLAGKLYAGKRSETRIAFALLAFAPDSRLRGEEGYLSAEHESPLRFWLSRQTRA